MRTISAWRGRGVLPIAAITVLCAAQCEDLSARQRAEFQTIIAEASRQLETTTVSAVEPGSESHDALRTRLEGLIARLAKARDGAPGQQAAADLLAGTARRELGALSLAQAEMIEAGHRAARDVARSQVDAALRLEAVAAGRERVDAAQERAGLAGEKALAEERLGALNEAVASLDGPIAEQEAENKTDVEAATQLFQEAAALRRQSLEQGHAAGLDEFEEAVRLEREADQHELRVAQRENDLRYDLRPEHEMAATQIAYYQSLLGKIGETSQALDERGRSVEAQVAATRDEIAAIRERVDEALAQITTSTEGPLAAAYDDTVKQLDEAITLTRRAAGKAGRDEAAAAKLALARSQELLARLHLSRARGLADQAELLARMIEAGDALGGADLDLGERASAQAAAQTSSEEALAAAVQALEEARESAAGGGGFGESLDVSLAVLRGEPVEKAAGRTSSGENGAPGESPPSGAEASAGFASAAEALKAIKSLDGTNVELAKRFLDSVRATDDASARLVELVRGLQDASSAFNEAVIEAFGQTETFTNMSGAHSALGFPNARLTQPGESEVLIAYDSMLGEQTLRVFEANGRWFLDGKSLVPGSDNPAGARGAEASLRVLSKALGDLTPRVRAGEFADMAALQEVMAAEMAEGMAQAMQEELAAPKP